MSAAAHRTTSPLASGHLPRRDHLRLAPAPRRRRRHRLLRRRSPAVLLTVTVLGAGFGGLISINTAVAQGAFEVHRLQAQVSLLDEQQQVAEVTAVAAASPERLAAAAQRLGMRPAVKVDYLRVPRLPPRG
jgi:hypothetical protein